jgi:hypothetical protein
MSCIPLTVACIPYYSRKMLSDQNFVELPPRPTEEFFLVLKFGSCKPNPSKRQSHLGA